MRTLHFGFALVVLAMVGCESESDSDSDSDTPAPTSADVAREVIHRYWSAWQVEDWDTYDAALADDIVLEFGGPGRIAGKKTVSQVTKAGNPWRDVTMTNEHYWEGGGAIVYDAVDKVTQSTMRVAELIVIRGGKIAHVSAVVSERAAPIQSSHLAASDVPFFELMPGVVEGPEQAFVYGISDKTKTGYFLRFGKDHPAPLHTHSHGYRGIVVRGVMRNGPIIDAAPDMPVGSMWTQAAGEPHITACLSETPCMEFVMFDGPFDLAFVE